MVLLIGCVFFITACTAVPRQSRVLAKLGGRPRFQVMHAGDAVQLVDTWLKTSDFKLPVRYKPDTQNVYNLFTRENPSKPQPIQLGSAAALNASYFNTSRRTIMLLHGWLDNSFGKMNAVLVPAFLEAEDLNVFAVDWSAGADIYNYIAAVINTVTSGKSVARFIDWLNESTGSNPGQFHIVGHSLGGHHAGITGRNVNGNISYITALDPALPGWIFNDQKFKATDGAYTEVIHSNAGRLGYPGNLGQVDFYPNSGTSMPGCDSQKCDHERCFHYLAESLISGGFTGTRCESFIDAMSGNCTLKGSLQMGGLKPKTGSSGIFYLKTNAAPPYSIDKTKNSQIELRIKKYHN